MPLPSSINDLSTTAVSNFPAGTDSPAIVDDVLRQHASYIAGLRDASHVPNATAKTTPVDADLVPINDSAAGNILKKLTWANLKATLSGSSLPIGSTTPSTGAFTTLSATNLTTISQDAAAQNRYLRLTDTNGTGGRSWDLVLRNGGTAGLFSIFDHTASASRLDIDTSGNLGVGGAPQTNIRTSLWGAGGTSSTFSLVCYNSSGVARFAVRDNAQIDFGNGAMTLDPSGNLLVGTTTATNTPANGVTVIGAGGATQLSVGHSSGTGSGTGYMVFSYNAGLIGSITQNGTTAVAFNTTSDYRLKNNVRPADALRFADIEFVDFEWVDGRHDCGVLAHKLQEIYPDLVVGDKDAVDKDGKPKHQQVNYIGLIPRMGVHIQKLMAQVAQLEADKATLLTVLASVDDRLAALESK